MQVTLDQAIEIHAKVLLFRAGKLASVKAKDAAETCKRKGDHEGFDVWMKVAGKVTELQKVIGKGRANAFH